MSVLLAAFLLVPQPAQDRPVRTEIRAARGLSWQEGDETVSFLTGGVTVERADFSLRAARAMVWTRGKSEHAFDEIYAEGNVLFVRRGGRAGEGEHRLRADRFYYSLAEDRGAIVDFKLKAHSRDLKSDFFLTAKEVRLEGSKLKGSDVTLTACNYGQPHFHLGISEGTLEGQQAREKKKGEFDPWPYQDYSLDLVGLAPELGNIPFFFFPELALGSWVSDFPLRSLRYGHSSRFGHFVYSEFGGNLKIAEPGKEARTWGEVLLEGDWREERGGATGLDLKYQWGGYEGYLDTYYLYDLGRDPELSFNDKFPPLERSERGKAHYFHRHELSPQWRYELEAYYLSDRSLLEEFFEREYKESKPPETAAYLRWLQGNAAAYVYERHRLNDFQTQDEFLPRAHAALLHQPLLPGIFDPLYLSERLDTVQIRRRFDEELHLETVETWRTDLVSELGMTLDFVWFQASPFVQSRITAYEDDLEGESEVRSIGTAGGRLTTQIHGTFPGLAWEAVGLRGMRHVLEAEVRYAGTFVNTMDPEEVYPFEEVDALDEFVELAFELRQRFLTKDAAGKPREFLGLVVGIEYYPREERDTAGPNTDNYVPPFNWIPVTADFENRTYEPREWSNLHYEAGFTPFNFLRVGASGEYNPETREEEVREIGAILVPYAGLSFSVGQTYVKNVTNAFTGGISWAMTPKWSVSVLAQYDYSIRDFLKQEFVVSRDFHDFQVEVLWERDYSRDEDRFILGVVPKFLGKAGARRSHLYRIEGVAPLLGP